MIYGEWNDFRSLFAKEDHNEKTDMHEKTIGPEAYVHKCGVCE